MYSIKDVVRCSVKVPGVRQTPEEGRTTYRLKRCGNNNKDEDNSPKTLNDKNNKLRLRNLDTDVFMDIIGVVVRITSFQLFYLPIIFCCRSKRANENIIKSAKVDWSHSAPHYSSKREWVQIFISAVGDLIINEIQALQHGWKKCVDHKRD